MLNEKFIVIISLRALASRDAYQSLFYGKICWTTSFLKNISMRLKVFSKLDCFWNLSLSNSSSDPESSFPNTIYSWIVHLTWIFYLFIFNKKNTWNSSSIWVIFLTAWNSSLVNSSSTWFFFFLILEFNPSSDLYWLDLECSKVDF